MTEEEKKKQEQENVMDLEFIKKIMAKRDESEWQGAKPEEVQAIVRVFVEAGLKAMAESRELHFRRLLDQLDQTAINLAIIREAALDHVNWVFPAEQRRMLTEVLSAYTMLAYLGFVGKLLPDELERLQIRAATLAENWGDFLDAVLERQPKQEESCRKATLAATGLIESWVKIMKGETKGRLTPEYAQAWTDLGEALGKIAESTVLDRQEMVEAKLCDENKFFDFLRTKYQTGEKALDDQTVFASLAQKCRIVMHDPEVLKRSDCIPASEYLKMDLDVDDPDAIFTTDWLRKGGAAMLVSESGTGKSVMALQMALSWAAGKEAFGFKPLRPLKIAIFQTEDDKKKLTKIMHSMKYGFMQLEGWAEEEFMAAVKRVHFRLAHGARGEAFLKKLVETQRSAGMMPDGFYDMVIVNPLQAFTGTDISENAKLTTFIREGLSPILEADRDDEMNKYAKDMPAKLAFFAVHHTNKTPQNQNQRKEFGRGLGAQYAAAGGAELTNWMRSIISLVMNRPPKPFSMCMPKGGEDAQWPTPEGEVHPTRYVRHFDNRNLKKGEMPVLFWLEDGKEMSVKQIQDPAADAEAMVAEAKERAATWTSTELRDLAEDLYGRDYGRTVLKYIQAHTEQLGIVTTHGLKNKICYNFK